MSSKIHIEVTEAGIRIRDAEIMRKDVADFFAIISPEERGHVLISAVEVGTFCLERANNGKDLEFVRRQVESLLRQVEAAVTVLPEATQKKLLAAIGTDKGQVLEPVKATVTETSKTLTARLKEVQDLLDKEIDPRKQTSTLGQALSRFRDLLDPQRKDSIQATFAAAIDQATAKNGPLAAAFGEVLTEKLAPLKDEVAKLALEVRGQEAAEEALKQTPLHGKPFEEETVARVRAWAKSVGAKVYHVGVDNQPGDIVIQIGSSSVAGLNLKVAIECKDEQTARGAKWVTDCMTSAMEERKADAGIYLSKTAAGLGKEVGDFYEGSCARGSFIVTTSDQLSVALRILLLEQQAAAMREVRPEVDTVGIQDQLRRIRTALARIKTINTKVTDGHSALDGISTEAEELRNEIRDALAAAEGYLRAVGEAPRDGDAAGATA